MNSFVALLKREVLEHKSLWKVPVVLLAIAVLVRLSFAFGNLSIDFNVPDSFNLESTVDSWLYTAIGTTLNSINYMIMLVMFVVSIFYALSSLYQERQDQSVLFWRSLPISDTQTVLSKLCIAIVAVPVIIMLMQCLVAVVFLGGEGFSYLGSYLVDANGRLLQILLWSMLPTISWCLLCSQIAKKNPFLLAFVAPLIVMIVDKLFLNGLLTDLLVINRLTGVDNYTSALLLWGVLFSVACLGIAIAKRGQRI